MKNTFFEYISRIVNYLIMKKLFLNISRIVNHLIMKNTFFDYISNRKSFDHDQIIELP